MGFGIRHYRKNELGFTGARPTEKVRSAESASARVNTEKGAIRYRTAFFALAQIPKIFR
jgi:hypothetical protein